MVDGVSCQLLCLCCFAAWKSIIFMIILASFKIILKILISFRLCFLLRDHLIIIISWDSKLICGSNDNWSWRVHRISFLMAWMFCFCWIKQYRILDHSWVDPCYLLLFIWILSSFWLLKSDISSIDEQTLFSSRILWFI